MAKTSKRMIRPDVAKVWLNVKIAREAKRKLIDMAGPDSQTWFVEELIDREYKKREKRRDEKLNQQLAKFPMTCSATVQ